MLVMLVMSVAVSMLASTISSTAKMGTLQLENAIATEAARERLEYMRIFPFHELYAHFNADPSDDPGGFGTSPGSRFAVPVLRPSPLDEDGLCGELRFPGDGFELREDVEDEKLGMPRDLNLDGTINATDISDSYTVLPVEVRVRWQSGGVDREYVMHTVYVRYE